MEQEIRSFNIELKAAPESRTIEGRAIPFNVFSPDREGFRELVTPEAVAGVIEDSDIFLLYNHDKSEGFLARSKKGKGTLKVDVREDGVYFTFDAKSDNLSNYVYERVKAGELDETSFAFTVAEDKWEKQADGVYNRTITKFERLYDFSLVDNSYYGIENAVKCKRFAEIQEEERLANEKRMAEEAAAEKAKKAEEEAKAEEEKKQRIAELHQKLVDEYKDYMK